MSAIEKFEDLKIWQNARELCKEIYILLKTEKISKDYELVKQIKKSSGSVMDNIAEGFERGGRKEFLQFLSIAKASCGEVRSQLHRAFDQNYLEKDKYDLLINNCTELSKMIMGFIKYLNESDLKGVKYK